MTSNKTDDAGKFWQLRCCRPTWPRLDPTWTAQADSSRRTCTRPDFQV